MLRRAVFGITVLCLLACGFSPTKNTADVPADACEPEAFIAQIPKNIRVGARVSKFACLHEHAVVTFALSCEKCHPESSYVFRKAAGAWEIVQGGPIDTFTCEGPEQPLPFDPCNELFDAYHSADGPS